MEILRSIPELAQFPGPLFLAIGVFDGVHLGHQAVISTSARHAHSADGTPVVVTFDPHPEKVLRPQAAPHLLTATQHKITLIRNLGVAHLLIIKFDKEFASTPPEKFVDELVANSKPLREICVGHEWSFGKGRAGNLDLLKKLGARFDFNVVGIPPVSSNGDVLVAPRFGGRLKKEILPKQPKCSDGSTPFSGPWCAEIISEKRSVIRRRT